MCLRNANTVPVFYFSLEQMKRTALPKAVDWCRYEKGAYRYPFFVIRTDPLFWKMVKVKKESIPKNAEATITKATMTELCPGLYETKRYSAVVQPKDPVKEVAKHFQKMEEQEHLSEEDERKALEELLDRSNMGQLKGFLYKEHLNFSLMHDIALDNEDFPHGWDMQQLPGKLTELLQGENTIHGVSTSNMYAGEIGTSSVLHVENGDLASANILLENSAGKAWFGPDPEEEKKLNALVKKHVKRSRKNCVSPLLHVDLMVDGNFYDDHGIRWYYCIQRPGDIVITNPRGLHQVLNLGYNLAESCNFICEGYKKIARRRIACQCPGRLKLYKELEPWKILGDYVYEGELEFLQATDANATLPPAEIHTRYRAIPSQQPWVSVIEEEEEEENDLGVVIIGATPNSNPMENVMETIQRVLNEELESAAREPSTDIFDDGDEQELLTDEPRPLSPHEIQENGIQQSVAAQEIHYLVNTSPMYEMNQEPTQEEPRHSAQYEEEEQTTQEIPTTQVRQQLRDQAIINMARNAVINLNNATQRQQYADTRADYYSQRHRSSRPIYRRQQPSTRAEEIRRNKEIADNYRESREKSRQDYENRTPERNQFRIRQSGPMATWFKIRVQNCNRAIANAQPYIDDYAVTRKWYRQINFTQRKEAQEKKLEILEKRRLLYNALAKMYYHSPEVLQRRIAEKYFEKELIRDFINYHNEAHRDLLTAALESLNADMVYWNDIFATEANWNEEFGVDADYRIPALDWTTGSI